LECRSAKQLEYGCGDLRLWTGFEFLECGRGVERVGIVRFVEHPQQLAGIHQRLLEQCGFIQLVSGRPIQSGAIGFELGECPEQLGCFGEFFFLLQCRSDGFQHGYPDQSEREDASAGEYSN